MIKMSVEIPDLTALTGTTQAKFKGSLHSPSPRIIEYTYLDSAGLEYIGMTTGSEITTDFSVPIPHRLIRIELKHTDASDADSALHMSCKLYKLTKNLWHVLRNTQFIIGDVNWMMGDTNEHGPETYRIGLTGTTNYRIYPALYIQMLG